MFSGRPILFTDPNRVPTGSPGVPSQGVWGDAPPLADGPTYEPLVGDFHFMVQDTERGGLEHADRRKGSADFSFPIVSSSRRIEIWPIQQ